MPYAVVTIETKVGEHSDVALPLDVPSQALASAVMQGLGGEAQEGARYSFYVRTEQGATRVSPNATLGEAGVLDGFTLQIKRDEGSLHPELNPRGGAFLRTDSGAAIPLEADSMVIGRKDVKRGVLVEIDLTSYDTGKVISRRHASITRESGKYYITDLASTNGTKLNGKPLNARQRMALQDGDLIEFGRNGVRVTFKVK